jgi:hypothetical protein
LIPLYLDSDAPSAIHGVTPVRGMPIKNKLTFGSTPEIILNNPADSADSTYDVETIGISPAYDETVEPNADRDGSISGEPRELQKIITIQGFIRATSLAGLYDKIAALHRAFNPVLDWMGDTTNDNRGFLPLKFAVPTTDTVSWPLGYKLCQFYVRPIRLAVPTMTKFDDFTARFTLTLRAVDPRMYEQTTQSANRTGSGNVACANALATYPSWPVITLAFTTIPSANITIKRNENQVGTVALDYTKLADSAGKTLEIDYQRRTAEYNSGLDKTSALLASSQFQDLAPASTNTYVFTNLPSDCVATVTWRRAFA